jgi:DivIVA domain-containing protein
VALDRQSIEKKDFPLGRRGYDPDAVDAHLSALAEEIDEYKRSARRRNDTLASSAADQVRLILEATENSAGDITRNAENDAREIREEASTEAKAARDQAAQEAHDHVSRVSESTNSMLQRLDAMEQEMNALIESLRTGANRLNSDLQQLEGNLTDVAGAMTPRLPFEPEGVEPEPVAAEPSVSAWPEAPMSVSPEKPLATWPQEPVVAAEPVAAEPAPAPEPEFEPPPLAHEPMPEAAALREVVGEPEYNHVPDNSAPQPDEDDDAEGARLIALNMALNGTPREETARYLSENFTLSNAGGLLEEVYASVEG